jgi:hypothetical protein
MDVQLVRRDGADASARYTFRMQPARRWPNLIESNPTHSCSICKETVTRQTFATFGVGSATGKYPKFIYTSFLHLLTATLHAFKLRGEALTIWFRKKTSASNVIYRNQIGPTPPLTQPLQKRNLCTDFHKFSCQFKAIGKNKNFIFHNFPNLQKLRGRPITPMQTILRACGTQKIPNLNWPNTVQSLPKTSPLRLKITNG